MAHATAGTNAAAEGEDDGMTAGAAPLVIWAIEQHVDYVGTFVDSLWLTQELAEVELHRLLVLYPDRQNRFDVVEWPVGEIPNEETVE